MDVNDPLSEQNKFPLGHSLSNGAVYYKINFKVIPRFIPALILLNPNNHYNHGFHNTLDYNHSICSD